MDFCRSLVELLEKLEESEIVIELETLEESYTFVPTSMLNYLQKKAEQLNNIAHELRHDIFWQVHNQSTFPYGKD